MSVRDLVWLGALAGVLLVGRDSGAADDEAEEIAAGLRRVAAHVEARRWKAGRDAIVELLEEHPGNRRLVPRLESLESDLRTCLFNLDFEPPHGSVLFGKTVRSLDHKKRTVEIVSARADADHGWQEIGERTRICPVPLEGDVEVTLKASKGAGVILCWNTANDGGYRLVSGYIENLAGQMSHRSLDRMIHRMDPGDERELYRKPCTQEWYSHTEFSFRRKSTSLEIRVKGKRIANANDRTYRKGHVAVFELDDEAAKREREISPLYSKLLIHDVTIEGTVDEEEYERALAAYRTEAFEAWTEKEYRPEKWLPEWALYPEQLEDEPTEVAVDLPSDAPNNAAAVERLVRDYVSGHYADFLRGARRADSFPTRTRRFVEGLAAMATGNRLAAREAFAWLAENEPHFGPGHAYLAQVLLYLRQHDAARASLARAAECDPDSLPVVETAAMLGLWDGDLEAASSALQRAADAGFTSPVLTMVRRYLDRLEAGPRWATRHEHQTRHFDIASDLSEDLCQEVGTLLEASLTAYSADFARLIRKDRARVYVFSGREGYLAYAGGLGADLEGSAGAYLPSLRQLVLWVPADRSDLWRTVKHEGFHQYLDNFLDSPPRWFDEGHAEYYESAGFEKGFLRTHAVNSRHVRDLRALHMSGAGWAAAADLMRLDADGFMADPELHYAQSWALVHFLRKPSDRRYAGLLERYFELLKDGASHDDAFSDVFADVAKDLDRDLIEYVRSLEE